VPIYEYRCANGHEFEVIQKMTDEPVATCERCDAPVERVFHPVAVHFKGSGFYTTDYAPKAKKDGKPESEKSESKSSDSGEKAKTESGKD
jgi:putative FmdB family regulatory protein